MRVKPIDYGLMAAFGALSLLLFGLATGGSSLGHASAYLAMLLSAAVYLLGLAARDRTAAVVAGALVSCALTIPNGAPTDILFDLLAAASLVFASMQQPLPAAALAALAASVNIDGVLLGIVQLSLLAADRSPRAVPSTAVFAGVTVLGWLVGHSVLRHPIQTPIFAPSGRMFAQFFFGVSGIVGWLAFPLFADLAEPAKRARWNPIVLWTFLYLIMGSLFRIDIQYPATIVEPFLAVVAAGGFARLLPVIASDFMPTNTRYALATAAVATLAVSRIYATWPTHPAPIAHNAPTVAPAVRHPAPSVHHAQPAATHHPPASKTVKPVPAAAKPAAQTGHAAPSQPAPLPHHVIILNSDQVKGASTPTKAPAAPPAAAPVKAPTPTATTPAAGTPAAQPDLAAEAARYGVPLTHKLPNGRVTFRNKWAVLWDIKERKAAEAAKANAPKPATTGNTQTPVKP